jgi:chromosome segregation ATPase
MPQDPDPAASPHTSPHSSAEVDEPPRERIPSLEEAEVVGENESATDWQLRAVALQGKVSEASGALDEALSVIQQLVTVDASGTERADAASISLNEDHALHRRVTQLLEDYEAVRKSAALESHAVEIAFKEIVEARNKAEARAKSLTDDVMTAQNVVADALQAIEQLQMAAPGSATKQAASYEAEIFRLREECLKLKHHHATSLQQYEVECEQLRKLLRRSESDAVAAHHREDESIVNAEEVERLEEVCRQLKVEHAKVLQEKTESIAQLKAQWQESESNLADLKSQMEALASNSSASSQAILSQWSEEKDKLRQHYQQLLDGREATIVAMRTQLQQAEMQVESSHADGREIRLQLEMVLREKESEKRKSQGLQKEKERLLSLHASDLQQLEEAMQLIADERDALQTQLQQSSRKKPSKTPVVDAVTWANAQSQIRELEEALEEATSLQATMSPTNSHRSGALRQQTLRKSQSERQLQAALTSANEELEAVREELERTLGQLQDRKKQVAERQHVIDRLQREKETQVREQTLVEENLEGVKKELQDKSHQVSRMQQERQKHLVDVQDLQQVHDEMEGSLRRELEALQRRSREAEGKNTMLAQESASLKAELQALSSRSEEYRLAHQGVTVELEKQRRELERSQEDVQRAHERLEQAKEDKRRLESDIRSQEQQHRSKSDLTLTTAAEMEHLKEEVAEWQRRLQDAQHRHETVQSECNTLRLACDTETRKREALERSEKNLQAKLDEALQNREVLSQEVSSLSGQLLETQSEIAEIQRQKIRLEASLNAQQRASHGLEEQRKESERENGVLRDKLYELEKNSLSMQRSLDAALTEAKDVNQREALQRDSFESWKQEQQSQLRNVQDRLQATSSESERRLADRERCERALEQMTREREDAKQNLVLCQKHLQDSQEQVLHLQQELSLCQRTIQERDSAMLKVKREAHQEASERANMKQECDFLKLELEKALADSKTQSGKMHEVLRECQAVQLRLDMEREKNETLTSQLGGIKEESETFRQKLSEAKEDCLHISGEYATKNARYAVLEEEKAHQFRQVTALTEQNQQQQQELQERSEKLQQTMRDLASAQQHLEQLTIQANRSRQLEEANASLQADLTAAREELSACKEAVMQAEAESSALLSDLTTLQVEKEILEGNLGNLVGLPHVVREADSEREALLADMSTLHQEKELAEEKVEQLEEVLEEKQAEVTVLRRRLEEMQGGLREQNSLTSQQGHKLRKQEEALETAESDRRRLMGELHELRRSREVWKEQTRKRLETETERWKNNAQRVTLENERLSESQAAARRESSALLAENSRLHKKCLVLEGKIRRVDSIVEGHATEPLAGDETSHRLSMTTALLHENMQQRMESIRSVLSSLAIPPAETAEVSPSPASSKFGSPSLRQTSFSASPIGRRA